MARDFTPANSHLTAARNVLMEPTSIAVGLWVRKGTTPAGFTYLVSKLATAGSHPSWGLGVNSAGDLRFLIGVSLAANQVVASPTISAATLWDNNWHYVLGTYDGTAIRIYRDGVEAGAGTTEVRPIVYNTTAGLYVGTFDGTGLYSTAQVAELTVWDAAPSAADRASLAAGVSAVRVRPDRHVMHWPLIGRYSPEIDVVNGINLTVVNAAGAAAHPRIFLPARRAAVDTAALSPTLTVANATHTQTADSIGTINLNVIPGVARPVLTGGSVTLDVTALPPIGETITGHSWAIQSGGGSLTNATTETPTYTAPASGSGLAVIRDTVTASNGANATADVTVSYHNNIVAGENALTGTTRSTWDLASPNLGGIDTLQGFCDGFTGNKSETVNFKIAQSDGAGWTANVYRLGWYGGNGARLYDTLTPSAGQLSSSQSQPTAGDADASTTKLSADCSNWSVTLTWTPPAWAPSGIYLLRLNRTGGGASHILFVVRDDSRAADLMLMPADSTWNAYNAWGGMGADMYSGNSLYFGTPVDQYSADCARFVSYNRPFVNRGAADTGRAYGAVEWSTFFTGEYPMVRFVERNGFDVKYYGCIDAAGDPTGSKLANVNAAMFVGHSEYWSDAMRAGWEAAKASGTSVFSCAGNEVFWRLVGTNADGSGRPRTWECQKSTINGRGNTRPEWTGTWRDPDGAGKGGDNPENQFTGTIFVMNGPDLRSVVVPFDGGYSAQPLWRHTTVAALTAGQSWTSPDQILGFEWDTYGPAGTNGTGSDFMADPHPQVRYCSTVTYSVSNMLIDAGDVYGSGDATHRLVVHPGGNGGIVFGTGTINWSLGCDDANVGTVGTDNRSLVIQQATVNMLVDMAASPATLMAGLTEPTPQSWFMSAEDATHPHTSTNVTLTQVHILTVDSASQTQTVDSPDLAVQGIELTVAPAAQAHTADTVALLADLAVAPAAHPHTADSPALTQVHNLTVVDAVQAQTADQLPSMVGGTSLTVGACVHAPTSDSPALTQAHVLALDAATQASASDSPALTQLHLLTVDAAVHAQAAATVSFGLFIDLTVAGATQAQTATGPTLSQVSFTTGSMVFTPRGRATMTGGRHV